MNCFNGDIYLEKAIDSILKQTYSNWEIVFWDNCSTDRTAEIIGKFDHKKINYYLAPTHESLGHSRNLALNKCRGELICFLDVDDFWLPNKLSVQVSWLLDNLDCDFLYSNFYFLRNNKNRRAAFLFPQPKGQVFADFLINYPVNLQTVMIRSELLNSIDEKFDGRLQLCEEYDLFMRLLLNCNAGYVHSKLVVYRIHEKMSTVQNIKLWPIEHIYVLDKLRNKIDAQSRPVYDGYFLKAQAKIAYYEARIYMAENNTTAARVLLKKYFYIDMRILILYYLTFFGGRFWKFIHVLFNKIQ